MESRPWPEWKRGKPITVRQLASLLRPFDVHPRNHCGAGGQAKAYFLDALRPVFDAYLPNEGGLDPSHRPQCLDARHFREFASVPARNRGTDRESRKLLQKEGLGRWDGWKPRITGERDGGCAVVVATARHNHRGRGVPESARWGMTPTTCTCPGARRSAQIGDTRIHHPLLYAHKCMRKYSIVREIFRNNHLVRHLCGDA